MTVINTAMPVLTGSNLPAPDGPKPGTNGGPTKFINPNSDNAVVSASTNGTYINANGDSQKL